MNPRIHALLASARVANLPGVIGNVWLGAALALSSTGGTPSWDDARPGVLGCVILAAVGFYLAGNLANDWADRGWDARRRPERALPRGWFRPRTYLAAALALTVCAMGLVSVAGPSALAAGVTLLTSIAAYTAWHKRSAWHVVWLGICRALLPLMGAIATGASWHASESLITAIVGLSIYIIGLSLAARNEAVATDTSRGPLLPTLLLLPVLALLLIRPPTVSPIITIASILPYAWWMRHCLRWRRDHGKLPIGNLLAGIPWVDWMFLLPVGITSANYGIIHPFLLLCLLLPPAAFAASLLLQRIISAS
jgi:4-hydroxybenzoate polyprenyltransferase